MHGTFSGSMKQRIGLAQALLGTPQLLILDEPTAGLDPYERGSLRNLLAEMAEQCLIILSTPLWRMWPISVPGSRFCTRDDCDSMAVRTPWFPMHRDASGKWRQTTIWYWSMPVSWGAHPPPQAHGIASSRRPDPIPRPSWCPPPHWKTAASASASAVPTLS